MKVLKCLERLLLVVTLPITVPLTLLMLFGSIILSLLLLPVAGIKFVFTGSSGITWWTDEGPLNFVIMEVPLFKWIDRLSK